MIPPTFKILAWETLDWRWALFPSPAKGENFITPKFGKELMRWADQKT